MRSAERQQHRNPVAGRRPPDESCPVFIVGPARSGTSLLYKTLCLHPDTAWISTWVRRYPRVPQLAALNRLAGWLPELRRDSWFDGGSNAYVYGRNRPLTHRLLPMPAEGEPVFRRCGVREEFGGGHGHAPDVDLLRETLRIVRRAAGAPVFLNKRIANNRRVPLLASALPEAKFVFIVRDGRAVAHSLAQVDWWLDDQVWWYGGTPRQWAAQGGDPWEICARNWVEDVEAVERGLACVPPSRRLDLRYEELVSAPMSTLEQAAEFSGLTRDGTWRRELDRLRFPDRNQRWRTQLDASTIESITAIQRTTLRRYGYLGRGEGTREARAEAEVVSGTGKERPAQGQAADRTEPRT